jgi:hypothetical protein
MRDASVVGLRSSIAAAPPAPNTLPLQAASAAKMLARSWSRISADVMTAGRTSLFWRLALAGECAPAVSGRSIRKRPFCERIAARSITFCSSRTLPGQS